MARKTDDGAPEPGRGSRLSRLFSRRAAAAEAAPAPEPLPEALAGFGAALTGGDGDRGRLMSRGILGPGGMGEVIDAFEPALERGVAVKVALSTEDPDAMRRFVLEARVASQLEHPNIVPVYDAAGGAGLSGALRARGRADGRSPGGRSRAPIGWAL